MASNIAKDEPAAAIELVSSLVDGDASTADASVAASAAGFMAEAAEKLLSEGGLDDESVASLFSGLSAGVNGLSMANKNSANSSDTPSEEEAAAIAAAAAAGDE